MFALRLSKSAMKWFLAIVILNLANFPFELDFELFFSLRLYGCFNVIVFCFEDIDIKKL